MRIKNKDIAEMLGISPAAVSMAINGKGGVSEETRKRIFQILQENTDTVLGRKYGTLLLLIHKKHGFVMNNILFANLYERIQQEALKYGYMLNIMHYLPGQDLNRFIEMINETDADGIILMATEMQQEDYEYYKKIDKPMIMLDNTFDLEKIDSVNFDNQTAIYRAFDYAFRMGHRNIGFLKSKVEINNFVHHLDGFYKGIRDYHVENYSHPVIELPTLIEDAYIDMKQFLENPPPGFKMPTIFLADLDHIAIGAMKAVKEAGYQVPEEVSFIGYDDIEACEASDPPLTTIRVDTMNIGRIAIERLLFRMKEKKTYHVVMTVSSELVIRGSVQKIE